MSTQTISPNIEKPAKSEKNEITVTVFSPRSPDPKLFTWPKTMRVGEAAQAAAAAFGYQTGSPGLQNSAGKVLDNKKPLVAEGVRDGDTLELVDSGGGV
jgi:hypothetical protein